MKKIITGVIVISFLGVNADGQPHDFTQRVHTGVHATAAAGMFWAAHNRRILHEINTSIFARPLTLSTHMQNIAMRRSTRAIQLAALGMFVGLECLDGSLGDTFKKSYQSGRNMFAGISTSMKNNMVSWLYRTGQHVNEELNKVTVSQQ